MGMGRSLAQLCLGRPASSMLVLRAGLAAAAHPACCLHPDAPLPASLCPRSPQAPPMSRALPKGALSPSTPHSPPTPGSLRGRSPPISPPPSLLLAAGAGLQEQGDIVRGCCAQVLGFPLSPCSSLLGSCPWVHPGFSLMLPSSASFFPVLFCLSNPPSL